jgi:hypothetical protein
MVMPYSNKKRHNPPSIPQTPYHPFIIPCPNYDPIYQVILLKIPMSGISSQQKEGSSKKREGSKD